MIYHDTVVLPHFIVLSFVLESAWTAANGPGIGLPLKLRRARIRQEGSAKEGR